MRRLFFAGVLTSLVVPLVLQDACAGSPAQCVPPPLLLTHGGGTGGGGGGSGGGGGGGRYVPPPDLVPPNPGTGGSPGAPSPGSPKGASTGAPIPGSRTGPVVSSGGRRSPAGTQTGARRRTVEAGFDRWEYWWICNRGVYFDLRSRLASAGVISGSAGYLLGSGGGGGALTSRRLTLQQFRTEILPALVAAVLEDDADLVDSSVLAIARSLPEEEATVALPAIVTTLGHKQTSAREAATLALGVLGSNAARPILLALASDAQQGRTYLRRSGNVPTMLRAFASLALGMIGDPQDIPFLKRIVTQEIDPTSDIKVCALLALGMYQQDHPEIVPFLLEIMERRDLRPVVCAQAPIALSRLPGFEARRAALPGLLRAVRSPGTDVDLRRSCIIALGRLATMEDAEVLDALYRLVDVEVDAQCRYFALIALGQIGSRDVRFPPEREVNHRHLETVLLTELTQSKRDGHRPWAALALGVYARGHLDSHAGLARLAATKLAETFQETSDPSHQAAIALALGLSGATETGPLLLETLEESRNGPLRGHLAVALGLMGFTQAAESVRAILSERGATWELRLNLARGLALLNDLPSIPIMIEMLEKSRTLSDSAALVQAIGLLGDERAVKPLLAILVDPSRPGVLRGFAAVGLGLLAEKTPTPWNVPLLAGLNYRAVTPAVSEVIDIL
ncbi:MAG: hypothetical protein AB1486_05470 [Planctomycetota bacterium]